MVEQADRRVAHRADHRRLVVDLGDARKELGDLGAGEARVDRREDAAVAPLPNPDGYFSGGNRGDFADHNSRLGPAPRRAPQGLSDIPFELTRI